MQLLDLFLHPLELLRHLVALLYACLQLLANVHDHFLGALELLGCVVSRARCAIIGLSCCLSVLLEVRGELLVRADELSDARKFQQRLGQARDRLVQPSELLSRLVKLNGAGELLLLRSLLLHLDRIVGQVTEGSVAVHRAPVCLVGSTAHQSAHLVLQREVLLLQLVILLLNPQMMLNLLRLVVMAHLHLVRLCLLKFLLQALLLISESFEG